MKQGESIHRFTDRKKKTNFAFKCLDFQLFNRIKCLHKITLVVNFVFAALNTYYIVNFSHSPFGAVRDAFGESFLVSVFLARPSEMHLMMSLNNYDFEDFLII